jgi:hypothetical protein
MSKHVVWLLIAGAVLATQQAATAARSTSPRADVIAIRRDYRMMRDEYAKAMSAYRAARARDAEAEAKLKACQAATPGACDAPGNIVRGDSTDTWRAYENVLKMRAALVVGYKLEAEAAVQRGIVKLALWLMQARELLSKAAHEERAAIVVAMATRG